MKIMTREEAMKEYTALVARYGLQWTPRNVPDQWAWDRMSAIMQILSYDDRREALGLPNVRPSRDTV